MSADTPPRLVPVGAGRPPTHDSVADADRRVPGAAVIARETAVLVLARVLDEHAVHRQAYAEHVAKLRARIEFLEDDAGKLRVGAAEAIRALRLADGEEEEEA